MKILWYREGNFERVTVMHDLELFNNILEQLEELRQWYEDMEDRVLWMEKAVRLSKSGVHIKAPRWIEAWFSGKIDA